MRMWMIPPRLLCRQHLLGEHVELHMLAGSLRRGKSVAGHLERGQLAPQRMAERHEALAQEMERRGYSHESPLDPPADLPAGEVDVEQARRDLRGRCEECRSRMGVSLEGGS